MSILRAFSRTGNRPDSRENAPWFVPVLRRSHSKPEVHGCKESSPQRLDPVGFDDLSHEGW